MNGLTLRMVLVVVLLVFGVGIGCDGSGGGDSAGAGDKKTEQPEGKASEETEKTESGEAENTASGGGGEAGVLEPANALADKVERVFEVYRGGGDLEEAVGEWEMGMSEREWSADRKRFQNDISVKNSEYIEVVAIAVEVGYVGGHTRGHVLEATLLPGESGVKIASVHRKNRGKRVIPTRVMPDNAPHLEALANRVTEAMTDPERCRSLPIASRSEIEKRMPAFDGRAAALERNEKAPARLDDFCETIEAWDGGFEFGVRNILVMGFTEADRPLASVGIGLEENADDKIVPSAWADGFDPVR